ncbi:Rep [Ninurtavirus momolo]|nr:Rep [Molossus molossus associated CRESS DNA virus]
MSQFSSPNSGSVATVESRSLATNQRGARRQGIFWLLTVPHHDFTPFPVPSCSWIRGQLEQGEETGYVHWQICCAFKVKKSLAQVKEIFGIACHAELSRSEAAGDYVWKEQTRVPNTQFEFGAKPFNRSSRSDWESIWNMAKSGNFDAIEAQVRICHYRSLRAICADFARPIGMERTCFVFWGATGTGKSRRAWEEATLDGYSKDPLSKFWCGYSGQENVVIDEFRGGISISHLLRWLDRYPVNVEVKGSSVPLCAKRFWITSNLPPSSWYPDLDYATFAALERRLTVIQF